MANQGTTVPNIPPQFFTNAGAPAAGYKLFTYSAGTTTKVNTYTNVALSVANANPIILDSAGRCTIFLTPGVSYSFVMAPPTDSDPPLSPIWTRDNVAAIPPSGTSTDLDTAGTAGENVAAGEVVYMEDGTGGTAGRWYRTDADNTYSSTRAAAIGMAPSAISTGVSGTIRIAGRITGLSGLVTGAYYYISATAGALTATPPTNARPVGQADSSTSLVLSPWALGVGTATAPGYLSNGTQDIAGAKTASGAWTYSNTGTAITSAGRVKITPRTPLANDLTDHATSGTGATDVWSVSVPASTILDGECLRVEAIGDLTGDTNVKTFTFTLGSTSISIAPNGNFVSYVMRLTVNRVSASVQRVIAELGEGLVGYVCTYAAWTENLGNTLTLKITLTHATSGTTTQRVVRSQVDPAP